MSEQSLTLNDRKRGAILGAFVADAASLGFHWLYDQSRIRALEPSSPEFRHPNAADYADVAGYFAHAKKAAGEFSQYGEQLQVMLQMLSNHQGIYTKAEYEKAFVECFGYGGSYVGYIDHPTRDTLNNIIFAETEALERANNIPFNENDTIKRLLITKVLGNAKQYSGDELKEKVEATVRLTHNDDYFVEHAFKILKEWESVNGYHGSNDTQLPALSKLPALVAAYTQQENLTSVVESAVRVTNNNDQAVAFGQASANMIEAAIITGDPELCIDAAKQELSGIAAPLIDQVCAVLGKSTQEVTAEWGMACQLSIGFPSAAHNIATSKTYSEAIQKNIYAGGDSCGRSILVGAVLGACYGVGTEKGIPQSWVEKLIHRDVVLGNIDELLND